jgi:predicted phage tail protein
VFLHGNLKQKFGGPYQFHCRNTVEAVRLLVANFPEIAPIIAKGTYRIVVGSLRKGRQLDESEIPLCFPEKDSIHIIPTISGAKRGGVGKMIAGVALLGIAAIATGGFALAGGATALGMGAGTWGSIAMVGASLTLSGIAQMLTPVPKTPDIRQNERPEDRPSFMLGGAVNVVEQGHPIPICGGRNILGGIVISVGVTVERMPT